MVHLVRGDLGESSSDPVWETGGGEVIGRELGQAGGVLASVNHKPHRINDLLGGVEVVLEVLKGQSVLKDVTVVVSEGPLYI